MAKVLIASNGGDAALRAARDTARLLGQRHDFTVLVIAPDATTPFLASETVAEQNREYEAEVTEVLDRTVAELGAPARRRIVHGDPAERIVKVADVEGFDLVVVGAAHHGRRLRDLLHRSVSDYVVEHAACPVLVVQSNGGKEGPAS